MTMLASAALTTKGGCIHQRVGKKCTNDEKMLFVVTDKSIKPSISSSEQLLKKNSNEKYNSSIRSLSNFRIPKLKR